MSFGLDYPHLPLGAVDSLMRGGVALAALELRQKNQTMNRRLNEEQVKDGLRALLFGSARRTRFGC